MCEHPKQEICGQEVCPTCYHQELMNSKDAAKNVKLETVYDNVKHMKVVRKAK